MHPLATKNSSSIWNRETEAGNLSSLSGKSSNNDLSKAYIAVNKRKHYQL